MPKNAVRRIKPAIHRMTLATKLSPNYLYHYQSFGKDAQCSFIRESVFKVEVGSATVEVDFDPDNNANCDKKIKINVNNGQVVKTVNL